MTWDTILTSPLLLSLFIVGSLIPIYIVLKTLMTVVSTILGKVFQKSRYLNLRKMPHAFTLVVFSIELAAFKKPLIETFGFSKSTLAGVASAITIIGIGLIVYQLLEGFLDFLYDRFQTNQPDNLQQRKIVTQLSYLEKILIGALVIFTLGLVLLRFENLEKIGGSLLASAGVVSIVIGFAAQESVSNLLAGFQIAFSQPLRIDDVVVVEGEWGQIEEINLTYVVVRIWDRRRLILPIKYFISQPFQNWTRTTAQVIGSATFYLDYSAPIQKIREKFEALLNENEKWDGDVKALQVTETSEKTLTVRTIMSASDAGVLWNLRCEIREHLIAYIQKHFSEILPQSRGQIEVRQEPQNFAPKNLDASV